VIRTQISLTEDQWIAAKAVAARRGISMAELLRRALASHLDEAPERDVRARALAAVGGHRSGRRDVGEHHDDALGADGRW
jgi:hypothetical protein